MADKKKNVFLISSVVLIGLAAGLAVFLNMDRKPPELTVIEDVQMEYGHPVSVYELIKAVNDRSEFTVSVSGDGKLDKDKKTITFDKTGTYSVKVRAEDVHKNAVDKTVMVTIADTQPPKLTAEDFSVYVGETPDYLAHATAVDGHDGDVLSSVKVDCEKVDTGTPGHYDVTYSVTDSAGNQAEASIILEVQRQPATAVRLSEYEIWLMGNEYDQLTATIEPYDWEGELTWSSSDDSIATVMDGLIVWKGEGECTITASADNVSAQCRVHCLEIAASEVWISDHEIELAENKSTKLTAKTFPSNWKGNVEWSSSNPLVAEVQDGTVIWKGAGSCTITAKAGEASDSCRVKCKGQSITDFFSGLFGGGQQNTTEQEHQAHQEEQTQTNNDWLSGLLG